MPAIIGPVQIFSIGSGGVAHFADALVISPKSNSKTNSGSGGFNTGGLIVANNGLSASNVVDTNLVDQPVIGNN